MNGPSGFNSLAVMRKAIRELQDANAISTTIGMRKAHDCVAELCNAVKQYRANPGNEAAGARLTVALRQVDP